MKSLKQKSAMKVLLVAGGLFLGLGATYAFSQVSVVSKLSDILTVSRGATFNAGSTVDNEKVVIKTDGKVGIGTTGPIRALHVNGEVSLSRNDKIGYINISDEKGDGGGTLWLRGLDEKGAKGIPAKIILEGNVGIGTATIIGEDKGKLQIHAEGDSTKNEWYDHPMQIWGNLHSLMFGTDTKGSYLQSIKTGVEASPLALNPLSGNVGIGTTAPGAKLEVYNAPASAAEESTIRVNNQASDGYASRVELWNANGVKWALRVGGSGRGDYANSAFMVEEETGGSLGTRFIIKKGGNVGIGTTDPGIYKLNVNGNAAINDIYITSIGKWASELYPVNLVNGIHTNIQCSSAGGTVVDDGAGNKMCKFTAASCPVTWTKYNNWSTTAVGSASYANEGCVPSDTINANLCNTSTGICSTTSHSWANNAPETKTCNGAQAYYVSVSCDAFGCTYGCRASSSWNTYSCAGATDVAATATITEIGCY